MLAAALMHGRAAYAADAAPACCTELDERVVELETASARKGNRAVSLVISGEVSRALLIWDDGIGSDTGAWRVNGDGYYCARWRKVEKAREVCRPMLRRGNLYELGDSQLSVIAGNPFGL
ncbi:MAG: hypothetical protein HC850_12535 [Rhodomicrobium sp.]|nr:hypothetical protein [Rhodomicrobium sp.]